MIMLKNNDVYVNDFKIYSGGIPNITERELDIVKQRLSKPAKTFNQLGIQYGVTKQCVKQIHMNAIKKIRARYTSYIKTMNF